MHNQMMDAMIRMVVHVGVIVLRVVLPGVTMVRFTRCIFVCVLRVILCLFVRVARFVVRVLVEYMVHMVPSEKKIVRRLVMPVMRVTVAEVGLSVKRMVVMMGSVVVAVMVAPLMVGMVVAKMQRVLVFNLTCWHRSGGERLEKLFFGKKTTAPASSLGDRIRVRILEGEGSTEKRVTPKSEGEIRRTRMVDVYAEASTLRHFGAIDCLVSALNLFIENAVAASLRRRRETVAAIVRST
jgi:hypothetical protein